MHAAILTWVSHFDKDLGQLPKSVAESSTVKTTRDILRVLQSVLFSTNGNRVSQSHHHLHM